MRPDELEFVWNNQTFGAEELEGREEGDRTGDVRSLQNAKSEREDGSDRRSDDHCKRGHHEHQLEFAVDREVGRDAVDDAAADGDEAEAGDLVRVEFSRNSVDGPRARAVCISRIDLIHAVFSSTVTHGDGNGR